MDLARILKMKDIDQICKKFILDESFKKINLLSNSAILCSYDKKYITEIEIQNEK
jgi:hypothetical protein